jgi:glycosyltransferase 2 family protein
MSWSRLRARLEPFLPALRVARFGLAVLLVAAMFVVAVRYVPFGSLTWWLLAPALAVVLVWWTLLARGWAILASGHAAREDMGMWCRTQVLRYLPGGIWAPTSRVVLVGGTAVDRVATVAAENVVSLVAALALGGAALAVSESPVWGLLVASLLIPPVGLRVAGDRTRLDRARTRRATGNALVAFGGYLAAAVLVQAAVSGWHEPLLVAGAAGVAWAFGLVVVFLPGGLGARELAYAGLLAPSFAHADLAAAAVVMRALTIVAELMILLVLGRPAADGPTAPQSMAERTSGARSAGEESAARRGSDGHLTALGHKVPGA